MNKKKWVVVCAVLVVGIIILAGITIKIKQGQLSQSTVAEPDDEEDSSITYKGKKYKYNSDITTVLFLGVDSSEKATVNSTAGNSGQSDTILLLVMNKKKQTAKILEISRDTMTDISIYDESGTFLAKEKAQIALQYAYGNSTRKSSQLTKNTVSDLLYGVPVRSCITLYVEGISKIVDTLGGVGIVVPEDYTSIDPVFTAGAQLTLNGVQAENYVRYRDTAVTGSNADRMNRQNQFILALIHQLKQSDIKELYSLIENSAGEYLYTDMSAGQMKTLAEYEIDDQIESLPGNMTAGEEHDEFYLNDAQVYEKILKMFYKPISK